MTLSNLALCTVCHHGYDTRKGCHFCTKDIQVEEKILTFDILKKPTSLYRKKRKSRKIVKEKQVCVQKMRTCLVCAKELPLKSKSVFCDDVCAYMESQSTYTKEGKIYEVTREEAEMFKAGGIRHGRGKGKWRKQQLT